MLIKNNKFKLSNTLQTGLTKCKLLLSNNLKILLEKNYNFLNNIKVLKKNYYSIIYKFFSKFKANLSKQDCFLLALLIIILFLISLLLYSIYKIDYLKEVILKQHQQIESADTQLKMLVQANENLTLEMQKFNLQENIKIEEVTSKIELPKLSSILLVLAGITGLAISCAIITALLEPDALSNFSNPAILLAISTFNYFGIPIEATFKIMGDSQREYFVKLTLNGGLILVKLANGDLLDINDFIRSLSNDPEDNEFRKALSEALRLHRRPK